MSKTNNQLLINEALKKNVFKMLAITFELSECAKNCSEQKNNMMADKKTAELYTNYKAEKEDIKKKLKLGKEYGENKLIYKYNKCLMNHCNKIICDVMKLLRSIISAIPENDPTRKKLDKMIDELEILLKKKELTKKEYKTYIKNMAQLIVLLKPR